MATMASSLKPSPMPMQRLFFRFAHPLGPTLLFLPIAIYLAWLSRSVEPRAWLGVAGYLGLGLFLWTFIEYLLHRFVFHLTDVREPLRSAASGLHMAHHRDTDAGDLITAPPLTTTFFGGLIFLLLWALSRHLGIAMLLMAGILIGYVAYEWVHFGAHKIPPRTVFGRYWKRYHLVHHFKHPHGTFGVTSPFWDFVFCTRYQAKR